MAQTMRHPAQEEGDELGEAMSEWMIENNCDDFGNPCHNNAALRHEKSNQ